MRFPFHRKVIIVFGTLMLVASACFANDTLYKEARALQSEGKFDEAISIYQIYLSRTNADGSLTGKQLVTYADALVQLMNSFQSQGEPVACISALQETFDVSPVLQNECLRDFYSVMGYALSRTENMKDAEQTTLKALSLPLHDPTPERYFRDYAYAAAVFYSNPKYQEQVIIWCQEALVHARSSTNRSGGQWVLSMLGSLYKRSGELNASLELFQQSAEESRSRGDDLGTLNSLASLVDLFLYWNIPEYADIYASEAVAIEKAMTRKNPMVSAQTYINKGRALFQLKQRDSISFYLERARNFCETLPYNSGMVDINLLNGICLTEIGGDSLSHGIMELKQVAQLGTSANRAKAYHRLALTYLKLGQNRDAEIMLDSLHQILNEYDVPLQILHLDYEPILDHYFKAGNQEKVKQYIDRMLQEQKSFKEVKLNYNLIQAIIDLQTGSKLQELKILQLRQTNQQLYIVICIILICVICAILLYQRKKHVKQIRHADEQLASLVEKLNRANDEKEKISQEVKEFLTEKDNRQEFETLTPYVLKESGETKFRQCFEILYPLFLPRLREKVPSVSRREELLSMLIALKQDNKNIAELLAIAPRSVLMLRHRFRQKIGMNTEYSLENFIEELLTDE